MAAAVTVAALGVGAGLGYLTDRPVKGPPDICRTGVWPPPPVCIVPGWRLIGPNGKVYRSWADQ